MYAVSVRLPTQNAYVNRLLLTMRTSAEAVVARLAEALGAESDSHLAKLLGTSPQTLSSWKSRDSVPYAKCVSLATENGWSLDWLLAGTGPRTRADLLQGAPASEAVSTIGSRLRDERESLGLTAEQLSEAEWGKNAGSSMQQLIEEDQKAPTDTYLLKAAIAGVDVLYVLTGERSQPVQPGFDGRIAALTECTRQSEKLTINGPHLVEALYVSRENQTRKNLEKSA